MDSDKDKPKQTVFKEDEKPRENLVEKSNEGSTTTTSTGLTQNIAGLLCYLFGFVTGVIFLLIEKDNKFVRFHAYQSIVAFAFLFILGIILSLIPFIGWIIGLILSPFYFALWVFLMYKAYKNEWIKLPVAGDYAEKQV